MEGCVIITGANGSLAIPAVAHMLRKFPKLTAILTVRNATNKDANTVRLRSTITEFPDARVSIHELDLADLTAVHRFADLVIAGIADGTYPPLRSILCNAFYWNMVTAGELTADGYEKTFQINHIANVALALRLVGSFQPEGGRLVFFSSNAIWPGKNQLEKYPPGIPDDIEDLVKVSSGSDHQGLGFQRYANSKVAATAFVHALNRHLEKDPALRHITAVAVDPGNLSDSRALRSNTPKQLAVMQRFALQPLRPLLRFMDPSLRTAAEAGAGVLELGIGAAHPGERGFFNLFEKGESSPDTLNEQKQQRVWGKSIEWAGITKDNTALQTVVA